MITFGLISTAMKWNLICLYSTTFSCNPQKKKKHTGFDLKTEQIFLEDIFSSLTGGWNKTGIETL